MCPPFTVNGECDTSFADASEELYATSRLAMLAMSAFLLAVSLATSCYITGGRLKHSFRTVSGKLHGVGVLVGLTLVARSFDPWSFRGLYPYAAYLGLQGLSAASMFCASAEITLSWKQAHAKFHPAAPSKERSSARRVRALDAYLLAVLPGLGVLMGLGYWLTRFQWWMIFQGHIALTTLLFIAWSLSVSIPLYMALIKHESDLFSRNVVPPEKNDAASRKFPKIEQAMTLPVSPSKSSRQRRRGGLTNDLFDMPSDSSSSSSKRKKVNKRTRSTGDLTSETSGFVVAGDTLASFDLEAAAKSRSQSAEAERGHDGRERNRERSRRPSRVVQEEMARAAAYSTRHNFRMSRYRRILYTSFLLSFFGLVSVGVSALNFYRLFTVPERLHTPPTNILELVINGYAFLTSEVLEVLFVLACLWFWRTKISLPNRRFRQKYHNRVAKNNDKANRKAKDDEDDKGDKGRGRDGVEGDAVRLSAGDDGQPFNGPRRLSLFGQTTWSISSAVSSVGDRLRRYSVSTGRQSANWPSFAQRDPSLDPLSEEEQASYRASQRALRSTSMSLYNASRDKASRSSATNANVFAALESQTSSRELTLEMTPFDAHGNGAPSKNQNGTDMNTRRRAHHAPASLRLQSASFSFGADSKYAKVDSSPSVSHGVPSRSSPKVNSSKSGSHHPHPHAHTEKSTSASTSKKRGAIRKRLEALGVYPDEKIELALAQYDNFHDCYGFLLMLEQREFEKAMRHSINNDRRNSAPETESLRAFQYELEKQRASVNSRPSSPKAATLHMPPSHTNAAFVRTSAASHKDSTSGTGTRAKPRSTKLEPSYSPPAPPRSSSSRSIVPPNDLTGGGGGGLSEAELAIQHSRTPVFASSGTLPSTSHSNSKIRSSSLHMPRRQRPDSSAPFHKRSPQKKQPSTTHLHNGSSRTGARNTTGKPPSKSANKSPKARPAEVAKQKAPPEDPKARRKADARRAQKKASVTQPAVRTKVPLAVPIRADTMSSVSTASSDVGPLPHELGVSFANRRGPRQVPQSTPSQNRQTANGAIAHGRHGRRSSGIFDDLIREKKQKQLTRTVLPPSGKSSKSTKSATQKLLVGLPPKRRKSPKQLPVSTEGPHRTQPARPMPLITATSTAPSFQRFATPSLRASPLSRETTLAIVPAQNPSAGSPHLDPFEPTDAAHLQQLHNHVVSHEDPFISPRNSQNEKGTDRAPQGADEFDIPHPSRPNNFKRLQKRGLIPQLPQHAMYSSDGLFKPPSPTSAQSAARLHSIHGFTPPTAEYDRHVFPPVPTTRNTPLSPGFSQQIPMFSKRSSASAKRGSASAKRGSASAKRGSASASKGSLTSSPNFMKKRGSGSASKATGHRRRSSFSFSHGSLSAATSPSTRHRRNSSTAMIAALVADDFVAELADGDGHQLPPTPSAPRTRAPLPFTPPHLPPVARPGTPS